MCPDSCVTHVPGLYPRMGGHGGPPIREMHTPSHSITQPSPARAYLGRRSGLPLLVCREKGGLALTNRSRKTRWALLPCVVLFLFVWGPLQAGETKATQGQAASLPEASSDGSASGEATGSANRTRPSPPAEGAEPPPSRSQRPPEKPAAQAPQDARRTELNLLGQLDAASGESRRNENVRITLIDNAVLKELNIRMGTTATVVEEFRADRNYFGSEFGSKPSSLLHLSAAATSRFHGNLYASHNNSIFSARSFFQVGDVRPARENDYGFTVGFPVWRGAQLTGSGCPHPPLPISNPPSEPEP